MKKTPLRKVSKKRRKLNEEYTKQRKEYLANNPRCQICEKEDNAEKLATDVHHIRGRGRYLLDETTWLPVCRSCHDKLHFGAGRGFGPKWARERGYLI